MQLLQEVPAITRKPIKAKAYHPESPHAEETGSVTWLSAQSSQEQNQENHLRIYQCWSLNPTSPQTEKYALE